VGAFLCIFGLSDGCDSWYHGHMNKARKIAKKKHNKKKGKKVSLRNR
jgi:hypothetical protein